MRGGVLEHLHLIESARDDPAAAHDYGADWDFLLRECLSRQAQGLVHERLVGRLVDQGLLKERRFTNRRF